VAISRMQRAYKAATKASIDELEALEGRIAEREANGEPPSETILWMRQRIIDNIEQLGKNLKKFSVEGTQITIDGQTEAATLANDATQSLVEAAAGKKPANVSIGSSWTNLPDEQLQAFVGFAGDGSPLAELFNKIPQVTTDAMQMALVQGISLGEGPRTVARRVRKAADIGRQRAETIARTEMIRASREAQRQLYTQNPAVQGYRRQATQDARVCLACLALSGTLQATDTIMPSHPNCRCVMIPATMSWAEITGDDSIPDTRPEVATPERILAGLTDAEKMAIMGPARFELYKNGKPLLDMVQIKQDKDWGPTTSVLPLKDIGGPLRVQLPTAPKTPKGAEAPKPIEVVKPSINRDPQALLEAFKKIGPKTSEQISQERDEYFAERSLFIQSKKAQGIQRRDALEEWNIDNAKRLEFIENQTASTKITDDMRKKMHKLMFSDDALDIQKVPYQDVIEPPDKRLDDKFHKAYDDCIDYVFKFIDKRKLSLSDESMMMKFVNLDEIQIFIEQKDNVYGFCEWFGEGRIALNDKLQKLETKFEPTFHEGSSFRTLAHEMMHWLDARDPALRKRISNFYERRTAGDDWEASKYGGEYKKDEWLEAYMGQRYKPLEDQGYGLEVPTRGIEYLLSDPLKFAQEDFDHFSFMITEVLGTGK
jgi:SPP1 gp7 family putative phage head morphogenesis protein